MIKLSQLESNRLLTHVDYNKKNNVINSIKIKLISQKYIIIKITIYVRNDVLPAPAAEATATADKIHLLYFFQ